MAKYSKMTTIHIENNSSKISFMEICRQYAVPEELLFELLEFGLISEIKTPTRNLNFEMAHLQRILSACRLHRDLEVNTHGAILALELMDELNELRKELAILRRHIDNSD